MTLVVNGETRSIEAPRSVLDFLAGFGLEAKMVVVERNGLILPRDSYGETMLDEGDVLEIVQMMAGG
jgi:sulfur carrier protein